MKNKKNLSLLSFVEMLRARPEASLVIALRAAFPHARVYVVGGAVRDFFLDRQIKDVDLVVARVPQLELEKFLQSQGEVALVGKAFGVFAFRPTRLASSSRTSNLSQSADVDSQLVRQIDIALPRTEKSIGHLGRYRDFDIVADHLLPIENDLSRRDFTINAMAIDVSDLMSDHESVQLEPQLIDPYQGFDDVTARVLRAVGDPMRRFEEDRSRVLRGVRFAVSLGFTLERQTRDAMRGFSLGLHIQEEYMRQQIIPREVVARELVNMFACDAYASVVLLDELNLLVQLFPEVQAMKQTEQSPQFHHEGSVFNHTLLALKHMKSDGFIERFGAHYSRELPFAVFLHDIGKPATKRYIGVGQSRITFHGHAPIGAEITTTILARLRLASVQGVDVAKIIWLVKHHMFAIMTDFSTIKKSTIEAYFLEREAWGNDLLRLIFLDLFSSLRAQGQTQDLSLFERLATEIESVRQIVRTQNMHLLTGDDLIRELGISAGPIIGVLLSHVREEQLQGRISSYDEAVDVARAYYLKHQQ